MRHSQKAILSVLIFTVLTAPPALSQPSDSEEPGIAGGLERSIAGAVAEQIPSLSVEERALLADEGEVTHLYTAPNEPQLVPAFQSRIIEDLRRIEPRLGVEVLFVAPAPDGSRAGPEVFTTLQSISTMEGIEYYSQSRGYMRTLFHESYVIDDPESRKRVSDPVSEVVPRFDRLYVFQRDSSFGKNVLQLDYEVDGETILLTMTNLTRMLYQGFIPAVGPGELVFHIIVQPIGDDLLFYGHSAAKAPSLFGLEDRIQLSFYNRIVALYNWYVDELARR